MKNLAITAAGALSILALNSNAQTNWKVDGSHSKLGFAVTHMMVSETEGRFKVYDGKISSKSETDFTDASIEFTADVNSINTDDEKRDGHLKSADFFDAAKYPNITFKATSMKQTKAAGTYQLEGDLTMHGVTKKITLLAVAAPKAVKDPYGNTRFAFKVSGKLNRIDYGLIWNAVLEAGGVAVSEEVNISANIELIKAK